MASNPPFSDKQKNLLRDIDLATSTLVAYAAKMVPPLNNLTAEGLLEELGRVDAVEKAAKATKEVLKERIKAMRPDSTVIEGDNFVWTVRKSNRYALNQEAAKAKLLELGGQEAVDACMSDSTVSAIYITRK